MDGERGKPGAPGLHVSTCTLDVNHVISNFSRFIANGGGVVTGKPWSKRYSRTQRIQRRSSKGNSAWIYASRFCIVVFCVLLQLLVVILSYHTLCLSLKGPKRQKGCSR